MSQPTSSGQLSVLRVVAAFLALVATSHVANHYGATSVLAADAPASARRPNIIVIVADDLGYHDVGFQGGKDISTPNLDSLAATGVQCTSGYVSCPVCSPTRAGLLTGRYQQRFGHEHNPGPQTSGNIGLPLTETTLANRLKAAGYHTGIVGKWHLGGDPTRVPTARGFDEFFGFLGGAHKYLDLEGDERGPIYRGTEPVDEQEYLTDAFGREAVAFVQRHSGADNAAHPFFLYFTFNAVHNPLEAPQKYLDRFASIENPRRKTYAAMLSALDDNVGLVLAKLREKQLENDTLIFFVSDNGGPSPTAEQPNRGNNSNNAPLSGAKGQLFEGGIRIPYVIRWKGHLPEGQKYDQPVITLDIHPTALAVAGVELSAGDKPLDGVSLLPYLVGGKAEPPHESLFWRFGPGNSAIRSGHWKLLKIDGRPTALYDLAADIGETKNLADANAAKVEELSKSLSIWDSQLEKPRWGRQGRDSGANPRRRAARRAGAAAGNDN